MDAWKKQYDEFLKQQGFGDTISKSNEQLWNDANAKRNVPVVEPKTKKQTYDAIPESTRSTLRSGGVDWDNDYNVVTKPKQESSLTTISNKNQVSNNSIDLTGALNGRASGITGKDMGMNAYYSKMLNDLTNRQTSYANVGDNEMANHYMEAINRFKEQNSGMNLNNTVFADWDTGYVQDFINNLYTIENSKNPDEVAKLQAINNALMKNYGMTENNYRYNDLAKFGADLMYGDFIKYGLDTEKGRDIPDITSTNMVIDPKFEAARTMARRDNLFGYEPIGEVKSINGTAFKPDYTSETKLLEAIKQGQVYNHQPTQKQSTESNGELFIPANANDESMGGVRKESNGKYTAVLDGEEVELSEDEFVKYMEMLVGF